MEIFVVRINGENVGFTYAAGDEPIATETFTAQQGLDGAPVDNADGTSSSAEPYADIVCFAAGTLIETPQGPKAVETLRPGQAITTSDHGSMPILWVRNNRQALDSAPEDGRPVLISAGALGSECPSTDLIVSPQHRVLVGGKQLGDVFSAEAFAPAKSLTNLPGIRHMTGKRDITWVHFACERHEVVISNGCQTESLLLGRMVLNGLKAKERRSLHQIFGPDTHRDVALNGQPARNLLSVKAARSLIAIRKQLQNRRPSIPNNGVGTAFDWCAVKGQQRLHSSGQSKVA